MMDWKNGNPNARYWVLKLIKDNFGKGDKLVNTSFNGNDIICQGFVTAKGRKILLINPRNKEAKINLPAGAKNITMSFVDTETGEKPVGQLSADGANITLKPFAVAVVQLN
jgi:hypothetical protein